MKNFCLFLILSIMSVGAYATDWKIIEVKNTDKTAIAGYIYYTEAVGTKFGLNKEKVTTGFRFVCSSKEYRVVENTEPIIAIFWEGSPHGTTFQQVEVKIDGKEIQMPQPQRWTQEGPLLYRKISESKSFIQAMRSGKYVSFSWMGTDAYRRTTIFDLQYFTMYFSEFMTKCEIQL